MVSSQDMVLFSVIFIQFLLFYFPGYNVIKSKSRNIEMVFLSHCRIFWPHTTYLEISLGYPRILNIILTAFIYLKPRGRACGGLWPWFGFKCVIPPPPLVKISSRPLNIFPPPPSLRHRALENKSILDVWMNKFKCGCRAFNQTFCASSNTGILSMYWIHETTCTLEGCYPNLQHGRSVPCNL